MKVGDRVVCIRSNSVLKKGLIYTIHEKRVCKCGMVSFNVGISAPKQIWKCSTCNHKVYYNNYWFLDHYLFRPIQYNSAHDELINKLKESKEEKLDAPIKEPKVAE